MTDAGLMSVTCYCVIHTMNISDSLRCFFVFNCMWMGGGEVSYGPGCGEVKAWSQLVQRHDKYCVLEKRKMSLVPVYGCDVCMCELSGALVTQ